MIGEGKITVFEQSAHEFGTTASHKIGCGVHHGYWRRRTCGAAELGGGWCLRHSAGGAGEELNGSRLTELARDFTLAEINNERGTIDIAKHARTARRQHGQAQVRAVATNHAYRSSRM
jgi:hypothetical protein